MPSILTKKEAAKFLRLSERRVDQLRESHGLPWISVGRKVLFSSRSLEDWIMKWEVPKDGPTEPPQGD